MKVGILDGGLTGLSVGYFLEERGIDFKILEKDSECGGLCKTKPVKIAQIIGNASLTGGPMHVLDLSIGLKKAGFNLLVILPNGPLVKYLRGAGIPYRIVPMKTFFDLKSIYDIRHILFEENINLIHCHGTRAGWLGRLAAQKIRGVKILYTEHLWTSDYHLRSKVREFIQLYGLKFLNRLTNKTIAVSPAVKEFLVQKKIANPREVEIIPNGISDKFIKVSPKHKGEPLMIGSVGILHKRKGYRYLIEALHILNNQNSLSKWRCEIVGDGSEKNLLNELIEKFHLKNKVMLIGNVKNIIDVYRKLDVYIQPSIDEAFGLALAEAMAVGLPVVASDVGGMKKLIMNGKSGFLVPSKNPKALASAISKLLNDKTLRRRFGLAAKGRIATSFSVKNMVIKTIKLYKTVTK